MKIVVLLIKLVDLKFILFLGKIKIKIIKEHLSQVLDTPLWRSD